MPIVLSGSLSLTGSVVASGNLTTTGTITAQTLVVQTITSSINYITGSSDFGSLQSNRHTFTGSLYITGSTSTFSGCVGIGTNAPTYQLQLSSASPSILLESTSCTGPAYLRFNNTARSNTTYIALGGTTNDLFFTVNGADRFVINGSGNVGIGTQTPNRQLSIQGPAESWIESITTQPTTQCWIFGQDGARKGFEVYDLNQTATRLFVAPATGNVGISNTCPRSPLSFCNGTGDKIDFYNDGVNRYTAQVNSGELRFYTCGTDRISLYAGNTVGLVNRSGKIAIAATSTDALFSIGDWCNRGGRLLTTNCSGWATDGVTPCVVIASNTTSTCKAQVIGLALHNDSQTANTYAPALVFSRRSYSGNYNSAIAIIQAQATGCAQDSNWVAGDLIFSVSPPGGYISETMRLTGDNVVLIGTTSTSPTNSGGMIFRATNATYGGVIILNHSTTNNVGSGFLDLYYNTSYIGGIQQNGASNVLYNTSSDYRIKEDLKDFNGLDKILSIKVYDFKWKTENSRSHGVIAHELQDIVPYAVGGEKDQIDENGKIKPQGVDYGKLTPILVKAIQEQQCTICSQASIINILKTCIGIS